LIRPPSEVLLISGDLGAPRSGKKQGKRGGLVFSWPEVEEGGRRYLPLSPLLLSPVKPDLLRSTGKGGREGCLLLPRRCKPWVWEIAP